MSRRKVIESFFERAPTSWWNPEGGHDKRVWFFKKQTQFIRAQLEKRIANLSSLQALDAGCGRGVHTLLLEKLGVGHVVSIDINHDMLLHTQEISSSDPINGSLMKLPFIDNSFDIVISVGTSMHVPRIKIFLSELHRVLKNQGHAAISFANSMSIYVFWVTRINGILKKHQRLYHRQQFTYCRFARLIKKQGFSILDCKGFAVVPPLSLKKEWQNTLISPFYSQLLSSPLDPFLGKYIGCGVTFIVQKKQ
jgi:ubiquinone/menaquinone biosynthesis C-methylase UbiE